jgi:hypothetical protein
MKYSWSKKLKGTVQRDGSGRNYVHSKGLVQLVQLLAIEILIASSAHSFICGLLFITDSCWQRRSEQIWSLFPTAQTVIFPVGKGAMNPQRGFCQMMPVALLR